ncbi:hypothetical protein CEXT_363001 [Caerostris extrusa]|uniref:Uncharacterized protein n=1 Tax=Caerostris extrusa TaxID=172846 RepID=A0AAV4NH12_CAEEX|nr:hypothetical protein CEXT_363001 [Caerostris extrusa]
MELRFSGAARVDAILQPRTNFEILFSNIFGRYFSSSSSLRNFENVVSSLVLALLCSASISTTSEMTEPPSEPCPKDCVCSGNQMPYVLTVPT